MDNKLQRFAKYEGAGNDFLLIDARHEPFTPVAATIARLCDRHFGVGGDGLMLLLPPVGEGFDCSMRYFNADGSPGEMCGNGGRCFALFAAHAGIGDGERVRFDSVDGPHTARILRADDRRGEIELGMVDVASVDCFADGRSASLNTGVPHYVELVDDVDAVDLAAVGPRIRYDLQRFPEGTNVNFITVAGPGRLRIRTWERGVEAETLACGTGATAAAIVVNRLLQPDVDRFTIEARGGTLTVAFRREGARCTDIRLSGPARKVFEGSFDWHNFE